MKHILNEAFTSDIIRSLTYINSQEHVNLEGKKEGALSKYGALFLTNLPILWDRISDRNIRIIGDAYLASRVPTTDLVASLSDHATNSRSEERQNQNLPSTVDDYEKFMYDHDMNSAIRDALGCAPKGTAKAKGSKYSIYKIYDSRLRSAEARLEEIPTEIKKIADDTKLSPSVKEAKIQELKDEAAELAPKVPKYEEVIKCCNACWDMMFKFLDNRTNVTYSTVTHFIQPIGGPKGLESFLEEINMPKEYADIIRAVYNKYYTIYTGDDALKHGAYTFGIRHDARIKQDQFTRVQNLKGLKYPTLSQFIDACIKAGVLYEDEIYGIEGATSGGDIYLDQKEFGKVRTMINKTIFAHEKEERGDEIEELYQELEHASIPSEKEEIRTKINALRVFAGQTAKERMRKIRGIYNSIVGAQGVTGEKTDSAESYRLLDSLYRHIQPVGDRQARIINSLGKEDASGKKVILSLDAYNEPFKVTVLTDAHFRILYVLSYYRETEDRMVIGKSFSRKALYGWKWGDNSFDVMRNYKRSTKGEEVNIDGEDYDCYGRISLDTIYNDRRIAIAIEISGDDSVVNDVPDKKRYIFGAFKDSVSTYTQTKSEDGKSVAVKLNRDAQLSPTDKQNVEEWQNALDQLSNPMLDGIPYVIAERKKLKEQIDSVMSKYNVLSDDEQTAVNDLYKTLKKKGHNVTKDGDVITIEMSNETEADDFIADDIIAMLRNSSDKNISAQYIDNALREISSLSRLYVILKSGRRNYYNSCDAYVPALQSLYYPKKNGEETKKKEDENPYRDAEKLIQRFYPDGFYAVDFAALDRAVAFGFYAKMNKYQENEDSDKTVTGDPRVKEVLSRIVSERYDELLKQHIIDKAGYKYAHASADEKQSLFDATRSKYIEEIKTRWKKDHPKGTDVTQEQIEKSIKKALITKMMSDECISDTVAKPDGVWSDVVATVVGEFVRNGEWKTVKSHVCKEVESNLKVINKHLDSRVGFLRVAFDGASDGATLEQHFYGYEALRAQRDKVTDARSLKDRAANAIQRAEKVAGPAPEIKESLPVGDFDVSKIANPKHNDRYLMVDDMDSERTLYEYRHKKGWVEITPTPGDYYLSDVNEDNNITLFVFGDDMEWKEGLPENGRKYVSVKKLKNGQIARSLYTYVDDSWVLEDNSTEAQIMRIHDAADKNKSNRLTYYAAMEKISKELYAAVQDKTAPRGMSYKDFKLKGVADLWDNIAERRDEFIDEDGNNILPNEFVGASSIIVDNEGAKIGKSAPYLRNSKKMLDQIYIEIDKDPSAYEDNLKAIYREFISYIACIEGVFEAIYNISSRGELFDIEREMAYQIRELYAIQDEFVTRMRTEYGLNIRRTF